MKKITLFFFSVFFTSLFFAQIPAGYYDSAAGKTDDVLRAALRDITKLGHVKLPYTSTAFDVWDAYAVTDVRPSPNNTIVWDMYSDIPNGSNYTFTIFTNQCGTAGAEGVCYAREHLTPNSWWGGLDNLANPQYTDLHHLFPADQYVNNKKSAYPLGEVTVPNWTSSNGSKRGPCSWPGYTGTVFEPINEYKGDFARATFYIAARYMDSLSIWVTKYPTTEAQYVINNTGNNFKQWYIDMLITWSNNDPVSQKEIERNNAIYYNTPQANRNPFVDHPEYICEIWTSASCTDAPSITNIINNPASPNSSNTVSVTANVTDNGSIDSVKLQWCTDGTSFGDTITMVGSGGPNYIATSSIPAQAGGTTVYYTITAIDDEGNSTTSPVQSYTVLKDEPTNHATVFTCDTTTSSSISLSWSDASGGASPDGYLIKSSSISYAAINDPSDGIAEVNSTFVHNVTPGTQAYVFTGLSQSTTYYFKIFPYTNSLSNINYKTSATVPTTNCATTAKLGCATDLIISEYIKGTSFNKYIEIYNNTGAAVDLSNYSLQLFTNGSPTVSTNNVLSGTLNNQATIVYQYSSAIIYGGTTTNNTSLNFNGDDAIALFKLSDSSYVDIFGRIGEDPGTEWTSGAFTTLNSTLVRNSSVTTGITANPTSGFPTLSTEWTQYATDDVSHLGSHTMDCSFCASPSVNSDSLSFSAVSQTSITINWLNGNGSNRLVVVKEGSPVLGFPVEGLTYAANPSFGAGNTLGTGEYIVYNASGSLVNVTNLTVGLTYYFTIFEYNCEAGAEIYLTPGVSGYQVTYSLISGSTNDNSFCITPTTGYTTGILFFSTGSFSSNTYTAQLSDALGSFASPVTIGTLISNSNSELITCNIPANTPTGSGYKIRVVSDAPVLTGTNSDPFEIILNPPPTGTTSQTFCNNSTVADLSATGTAIQWYAASSGGTALTTTTPLVNSNHYFATQTVSTCESATRFDVTVTLTALPVAPVLGTIAQPTCSTATGSVNLSGLPSGNWTVNPGNITGSITTTTISGLAVSNTYNYTVTDSGGCTSAASANVVINAQPTVPAAATASATIQPTCALATGTIVVTAPTGAYEYNIDGGVYQSSDTFASVAAGSHSILVRRTTDSTCISSTTAVTVNAQPTAPAAATANATIQPTCALATGTIVITAPTGAYEYNMDGGTYQASATFAGVAAGSHNILVRRTTDSTCISSATAVTVNAQPTAPAAATASSTIQPTCAISTGTIVVTAPTGAYEYNIDGGVYQSSATFAGVAAGSHNILVRRTTDSTCVSSTKIVNVNAQPTAPAAATASTTIQPTCALATGTIVVTAPTGAYEYNIDGGAYQSSATFAGLAAGSHSILVRRTTDSTCISSATAVTIDNQPTAPATPIASTTIQPTCALATGTIVITSPTGAYEYNIDGGTYQPSATFAGTPAGSYSIIVRSTTDSTCISSPTAVTVNSQPITPAEPTASVTTQPSCTEATGTITVTSPVSGFTFSVDGSDYTNTSGEFSGISPGTYYVTAKNSDECISTGALVTINAQPLTPTAPTGTAAQTFCNNATVADLSATGTAIQWYAASSGGTALATTTDLIGGTHYFATQTENACESSTRFDITATIDVPETPTGTVEQAFCNSATVADLSAAGTAIQWYTASSGGAALAITTALVTGINYFASQTENACESATRFEVSVTINEMPALTSTLNPDAICSNALFSYTPISSIPNTDFSWSRDSVTGISNLTGSGTDNPNETLINTTNALVYVTYVYELSAEGCTNAITYDVMVQVNPLPAVSLLPLAMVCSNLTEFPLTGGSPIGGVYTGTGVSSGVFYPGSADSVQTITYTITDSNSCSNAASENIVVRNCTGMEENTLSQEITVFPNPTNGIFNIVFENKYLHELLISINDIQGREVFNDVEKNYTKNYTKQINLSDLAKGIYYIKLTTAANCQIQKLILE